MSGISREDALRAFYQSLGQNGIVSEDAFIRNGNVKDFEQLQVQFDADVRMYRNEVDTVSDTPQECPVCTTQDCSQQFELPIRGCENISDNLIESLDVTDVPYEDTQLTTPIKETHSVSKCPECSGNGKHECDWCAGEGVEECPICNGLGQIEDPNPCPMCDGERCDCEYCDRKGRLFVIKECDHCYGAGNQSCATCGGTGQLQCEQCGQTGEVHSYDLFAWFLEVSWYAHGFPSAWGGEPELVCETLKKLNLDDNVFNVIQQSSTKWEITTPQFEVGVLNLKYRTEEYLGLAVLTPIGLKFVFNPTHGPIETNLRRKVVDIFEQISIWK